MNFEGTNEVNQVLDSTLNSSEVSFKAEELDELDGIDVATYSLKSGLTTQAVWNKIRTGELVARTENGSVFVYSKIIPLKANTEEFTAETQLSPYEDKPDLPPLPQKLETPKISYVSNRIEDIPAPSAAYLAVLMENLKSSKEEQREIIRLTQESVKQITSMAEKALETKDILIKEKDLVLKEKEFEIEKLNEKLSSEQHNNLKLKQEKEDLEILVKAFDS